MKWSERGRTFLLVALGLVAALSIGRLRGPLAERHVRVAAKDDVLLAPSPEQVLLGSLGYRSALADFIYAHTLVAYGQHLKEKRRFEFVAHYLDVVTTLDPKFRQAYYFADTLITLQATASSRKDYEDARRLLERGIANHPFDTELWLVTGQFLAYLAPQFLRDEELSAEWRKAGARVLSRTCELVGSNENIPFHCITAAALFDQAQDREATVRFLTRAVAILDDPELRALSLEYLKRVAGERERERIEARKRAFEEAWRGDLGFVGRTKASILGPGFDPAACAGGRNPDCVVTWRDWGERYDARVEGPSAP